MRSMGATPVLLAAIVALAATARPSPATEFGITALLGTGSQAIEHNGVTGDDRGGIAVSSTHVFYSGDSATGRFNLADLSGGASAGAGCLQECASIIDAQGGAEGAAFRAAAQVRTCAIASSCSSCLAAEPAPPASCSRENSCQGCPDCFRECLCSGERFGDCKELCGEDAPPAACTPESGCVGCTSCFELCACDGGTFEECTSACQPPAPPEPPPAEPCSAATDCSDCSDCLATCACEGGELAACEAACSPPPVNDVCVEALQSGGEDTCGGCGGCLAECTCRGGSLEACMASNACNVCSQSSGDMAECVCDGSDSADECADDQP